MTGATIHPTSVIDPGATLGEGVRVGPFALVGAGVTVGDGTFVDSHCVLGSPAAGYYADPDGHKPAPTTIGPGSVIRSHCVIYEGVTTGERFECGHHVTIREGCRIGDGVRVGTACDLQPEVELGDHTRLHSSVFAARGSVIEPLTWLFPGATLLDDPHPPSDECTRPPAIRRFAVVGARATIGPGVEVGEGALVGASSLVREDVPASTVVVGVPAREIGATADVICRHGNLEQLYPWWLHFRRGYPDGVLPDA
jgi:acetyltransferase-like isoleucine patch superfamily enzyme